MKALDEPTLKSVLGQWLSAIEIRAILERREMMERKINNLMGGAAFFLTSYTASAPLLVPEG